MSGLKQIDFEPHIASIFEVVPLDMDPVAIELVEVKDTGSASLDSFSLMFKGSTAAVFRHDTHLVRHAAMGKLELFLGPVHTGKTDAVYYQAIFSSPKGV
jgi:hypothetical protein